MLTILDTLGLVISGMAFQKIYDRYFEMHDDEIKSCDFCWLDHHDRCITYSKWGGGGGPSGDLIKWKKRYFVISTHLCVVLRTLYIIKLSVSLFYNHSYIKRGNKHKR